MFIMGFIKWNKGLAKKLMAGLNVDWYGIACISCFKGLLTGLIICHFLLM